MLRIHPGVMVGSPVSSDRRDPKDLETIFQPFFRGESDSFLDINIRTGKMKSDLRFFQSWVSTFWTICRTRCLIFVGGSRVVDIYT